MANVFVKAICSSEFPSMALGLPIILQKCPLFRESQQAFHEKLCPTPMKHCELG